MKKLSKISLTAILGLIACVSLAFGLSFAFKTPQKTASAAYSGPTVSMFQFKGVSIKFDPADANDGIRYAVKIDETTYNNLTSSSTAVAAVLIAPVDAIPVDESDGNRYLNVWTASSANALHGILYRGASVTGGYVNNFYKIDDPANGTCFYEAIVSIKGFPSASYNRPIRANAYIDWTNGGNSTYIKNATNSITRSMAEVADTVIKNYSITEAQATKLDGYRLNYTVKFIDEYGNESTQSVKYGSTFSAPSTPASRTGYTFNGWAKKTGASTYGTPAKTIADTTVTKNATYKADISANGPTYEKPVITEGNWLYGTKSRTISSSSLALKGMYQISDVEAEQGADYLLSATFTRASTNEVGFVITTTAVATWNANEKPRNLAFVYRSGGDMYMWGNSIWRSLGSVSAPAVGSSMKITIVHKAPMFYVFVGNSLVCSVDENTNIADGDATPKNAIGTSGTIKFGLASTNAVTTFTDWRCSTDADVVAAALYDLTNPLLECKIYDGNKTKDVNMTSTSTVKLSSNGDANATTFFSGVEINQSQDFVIYADINSGFTANGIGFVIASDTSATDKHVLVHWRSDRISFWRNAGGWAGYDGTDPSYTGYGSKSASKHLALVYRGGRYYLFMNGQQVFNKAGTDNVGWSNTINGLVGTTGTKKIGLSCQNGVMTCSDWGYSTSASDIAYHAAYNCPQLDKRGNSGNLSGANGTDTWANITAGDGAVATAYCTGIEIAQNQSFVIYTRVQANFASQIGFVVGTNPTGSGEGSHMLFQWRKDDIYIWRHKNHGWAGHENNIFLPGYSSNSSAVNIALLYKNSTYYMFLNGSVVWSGTENGFSNGWGGTLNLKTQIGSSGTKKIGFSLMGGASNQLMDINTWGFSTNADYINTNYPTS